MQSKIIKKGKPEYNKEFVIKQLFADPNVLEMHKKRLKELLPKDVSDEDIKKRIHAMVVKENAFNTIMEYLSKLYEYEINATELNNIANRIAEQFKLDKKKDEAKIKNIAEKIIIKSLIFKEFAADKKLEVADEEAKEYLEKYYKETNQPINELLNSKDKFKEVKEIILEEKITENLLASFKIKFELD
ncbi:MAG: hypothetical protein ACRCVI_03150 [Mycoplasmoidaceae bacterium]